MASTGEVPQAPASAELPPFPEKGVSLSFLRRFVAANQDLICPKTTAAPDKIFKSLGGLIVSANNLRLVPWNEKEIAQVESELCAIGLSSVALLREALVMELVNDDFSCIPFLERLQSTGKELLGFAPELLFARALQIEGFGDSVSMPQKQALTTSQVCREIVQPATEGTGGAYVDLLLAEQNQSASLPSSMTPPGGESDTFCISYLVVLLRRLGRGRGGLRRTDVREAWGDAGGGRIFLDRHLFCGRESGRRPCQRSTSRVVERHLHGRK